MMKIPIIMNKAIIWGFAALWFLILASCSSNSVPQNEELNSKKAEQQQANPALLSVFDSLNKQIKLHPDNALLYNERANFFLVAGDHNKALGDVNKALQLDSVSSSIWVTLADVYFAMERFVDSREMLLKAINLDPKNTSAMLKLARLYLIYKDYATAMKYINSSLVIDPMLKDAYFMKGVAYAEGGDTTKAIYNYQKAVESDPQFYDAWIELGNLFSATGKPLAENYYRNAYDLDTNNTHAIYIMAYYYQESGNFENAEYYYQSLLNKEKNKNALFNLGYINMVYKQNYTAAISFFQQALDIDPDYTDALFNLAYSLQLSGDKADARLKYKDLLKRVPNHEGAIRQLNSMD